MNRIQLAVLAFTVLTTLTSQANALLVAVDVPLSFLDEQLREGNVKAVEVLRDRLEGEFLAPRAWNGKSVTSFATTLPESTTSQWTFTHWLLASRNGAVVTVRNENNLLLNIIVPLIPWALIFTFIWFFVFRQLRRQQKAGYTGDALHVFVVNPPASNAGQPPVPAPPLSR